MKRVVWLCSGCGVALGTPFSVGGNLLRWAVLRPWPELKLELLACWWLLPKLQGEAPAEWFLFP